MRSNEDASKQENYSDAIAAAAIVGVIAGGTFLGYKGYKGVKKIPEKLYNKRYNAAKAQKKYYEKYYNDIARRANQSGIDKTVSEVKNEAIRRMDNELLRNKAYKDLAERKNVFEIKRNNRINNYNKIENPNTAKKIGNTLNNIKDKATEKGYSLLDKLENKINPYYGQDSVYKQINNKLKRANEMERLAPKLSDKELINIAGNIKKGKFKDIGYNDMRNSIINELASRKINKDLLSKDYLNKEKLVDKNLIDNVIKDNMTNGFGLENLMLNNGSNNYSKPKDFNFEKYSKNPDNKLNKKIPSLIEDVIYNRNPIYTIENGNIGLTRDALKLDMLNSFAHPNVNKMKLTNDSKRIINKSRNNAINNFNDLNKDLNEIMNGKELHSIKNLLEGKDKNIGFSRFDENQKQMNKFKNNIDKNKVYYSYDLNSKPTSNSNDVYDLYDYMYDTSSSPYDSML